MNTQLFSRDGQPRTSGYRKPCSRCGGAGGSQAWAYTGYTCYQCGGVGKGDVAPLYTAEKLAKLNAAAEKRAAAATAKRNAAMAVVAAERAAGLAVFLESNAAFIASIPSDSGFWSEFKQSFIERQRDPSAAQVALVERELAKRALPASRHLGVVGEKVTLVLTTKRIVTIQGRAMFYGDSGLLYITIMSDADGNVVTYKGKSNSVPNEGATATISATVKVHDEFNGVKQTVIQRPKVVV
jgi:hypothetical protein